MAGWNSDWGGIEAGRGALDAEGGKRVIMIVTDGADNASRAAQTSFARACRNPESSSIQLHSRRVGLDTTEIGALANSTVGRTLEPITR